MNLISFTHVVTRAGAAFGFSVMAITAMVIFFRGGRRFAPLRHRTVWLPWLATAATMILASAVTGGFLSKVAGGFTASGDVTGAQVGHLAVGQDDAGAVQVSATQILSYSGSWLVLCLFVGVCLFVWYAKGWSERIMAISGGLTGATWGIASSVGGWAAAIGVPFVSWLGKVAIG